ncbi:MAG: SIMPL domain-containing protein [Phycisphaerales bacterium]|jgi:hypothetical protein|nr:SIMPL domain-containing protein [Phycisphaerales bacterium]
MIRLAIVISLLAPCVLATANSPRLTVQGESRLEVPADQFSLTIGATATATTVEEARTEVDATMTKLVAMVTKVGLTRDTEWHTGRYDITPQWKPRPRGQHTETWTPEIIGYSVRSSIAITTGKMTLAGVLVAEAAKAGANDIGALNFSLSDPRSSRSKAIQTATRHAITDATTLAEAADVDLVRILQLSLDGAQTTPPRPIEYKAAMVTSRAYDMMDSAPDITAGTVTVTATVTAEWEIAPTDGAQTEQSKPTD